MTEHPDSGEQRRTERIGRRPFIEAVCAAGAFGSAGVARAADGDWGDVSGEWYTTLANELETDYGLPSVTFLFGADDLTVLDGFSIWGGASITENRDDPDDVPFGTYHSSRSRRTSRIPGTSACTVRSQRRFTLLLFIA